MGIFNHLRAFFSRGTTSFNSLELQIFRETMKLLDPTSADRMQRRIDQINLVQRLGGGEQVNSYQMIKGKPALDRSTSLPTSCGESILAVFKVMRERNLLVSGKIWLVDGMLFSLEFDKPTEHLVDDASLTVLVELN